jgi:hypothetical protein
MKDNRLGAIALILGAVSGIITLTFHPTGGGAHHVSPAQFEILIAVVVGVHALAIAGLPFSFLGALVLSRRLDSPNRLATTALVIYGFSLAAIMFAATMSGLVTPGILRKMVAHSPSSEQWRALVEYTHLVNQGFAKIGAIASCVAVVLWSALMAKNRAWHRVLGIYGLIVGIATVIAIVAGALDLELHGFRLITFTQGVWFIAAGVLLWRLQRAVPDSPNDPLVESSF